MNTCAIGTLGLQTDHEDFMVSNCTWLLRYDFLMRNACHLRLKIRNWAINEIRVLVNNNTKIHSRQACIIEVCAMEFSAQKGTEDGPVLLERWNPIDSSLLIVQF